MTAEFLASPLPARHGFFTRRGGVSRGPYASLNGSLSGGDDPADVAANRALAARALGTSPERMLGVTQVHGTAVATVDAPWLPGQGPRADALVTACPDFALGIITADCAPVLFADPEAGIVAAAHAGWRGAVAGILEATIDAMLALGADRARIHAAVGPCIAQPSYEVSADLRDTVLAGPLPSASFFRDGRPGHWQFDLAGYCAARLHAALPGDTVSGCARDTAAEPDMFFSHRRRTLAGGGAIGHQMSVIASHPGGRHG